ncbi:cytochrome c biogenesis heme-transporting ATPase CcmA [Seongchinamella sediminis]|uniref:Cytochrome c biogenesis heme-transporting ATPase CcmA n=1 Tax=Seongchinamella sediminis TaxID=2283635 RepID=A0A3L7E207_9GAMM|nr:cytochrome c biogenesis heme-transporting ATPase CcmA [Seongchinamella sediminis]RLQ23019.1 cytochrome c biogenesis heme-transporting ATPase CcmA [Seongchinamella sediminis]
MLAADNLSLERGGRQLFQGLSFEVFGGQLVQVEGANGAGKTSLIRILAGLSRYGFEGRVVRAAAMLYLGHHSAVKAMLTPRENLAWHVSGEGLFDNSQIEEALARVGLYGYEDVPSHALSAGQHRRVNLARLYLSQSPLWLLDEPFTAIDVKGVRELESLFAAHAGGGGAVLLTSHQALAVDYPISRLNLGTGIVG